MTAYELTDAFMNHVQLGMTFFMAFLSATSAFLMVAYIAGSKLPAYLAKVVLAIYTLASIFLIFSFHRVSSIFIAIREEMHGKANWHPAVYEPQAIIHVVQWLVVAIMTLLYLSSLWYYWHVRNNNETPLSKPLEVEP